MSTFYRSNTSKESLNLYYSHPKAYSSFLKTVLRLKLFSRHTRVIYSVNSLLVILPPDHLFFERLAELFSQHIYLWYYERHLDSVFYGIAAQVFHQLSLYLFCRDYEKRFSHFQSRTLFCGSQQITTTEFYRMLQVYVLDYYRIKRFIHHHII